LLRCCYVVDCYVDCYVVGLFTNVTVGCCYVVVVVVVDARLLRCCYRTLFVVHTPLHTHTRSWIYTRVCTFTDLLRWLFTRLPGCVAVTLQLRCVDLRLLRLVLLLLLHCWLLLLLLLFVVVVDCCCCCCCCWLLLLLLLFVICSCCCCCYLLFVVGTLIPVGCLRCYVAFGFYVDSLRCVTLLRYVCRCCLRLRLRC